VDVANTTRMGRMANRANKNVGHVARNSMVRFLSRILGSFDVNSGKFYGRTAGRQGSPNRRIVSA
jgi:hypothetical protein